MDGLMLLQVYFSLSNSFLTVGVKERVKNIQQLEEKNKDGPHVVTRKPSFLNDKGQLDKKVKSGQLEEHTEATQPDLQTQIPSKGPESEKMEDEEAKFADESSTQIILHKPPAEEQKQDVISDQDTEKTIEETKKEKEEKKSDGMREKGEPPTSSGQTVGVKERVKNIQQLEEKNKDGPHVVTRKPSFLNDKGQLDKKVKSGQLEEHTEATQPDLQTQIPSKGPGLKIKLCQLDSE
ncbi:uncharacterized protein LOC120717609 isoform X3 [Simochromis diagramma]|uniref:uncharacterized protein LOC120717609 isoform X3 n=1 Tax=Simochromis diagramma TaxID=43689 RepID=UPI001A7E8F9F|nr:uncharacterized protein LOC120717609 isoform X3 [Simochromis diagramma]